MRLQILQRGASHLWNFQHAAAAYQGLEVSPILIWRNEMLAHQAINYPMCYDIYFVDHADRIFGRASFEAVNDAAAIERGRSLYRTTIGRGHEIWREDQHVHSEVYGSNSGGAHNGRRIRNPHAPEPGGLNGVGHGQEPKAVEG